MGVDDNVWGSGNEEECGDRQGPRSASDLDREWQARQNQFHTVAKHEVEVTLEDFILDKQKLGYRDGVEAGKNSSVQEGFNVGYAEASIAGFNWGVARGITSAFAALSAALKKKFLSEGDAIGRWEGLNTSISSYSSTDALRSYYHNSIKPLELRPVESDAALGSQTREEDERPLLVPREEESLDEAESVSMAGVNRPPEIEGGGHWEPGGSDGLDQFPVPGQDTSAPSCSTNEVERAQKQVEQPGPSSRSRRVSTSRPDGTSIRKVSASDLIALEESLKKELVLENHEEIAPLTVPSTPVRSEMDELQKRVRMELELASIKLSEIAPAA